jgi:hypothetical protein
MEPNIEEVTIKIRSHTDMDALTAFGLFAVIAMLLFYALEDRSPWYVLAFAGACALASSYGFLQGAWPFGIIEAVWTLVAVRRWQVKMRSSAARTRVPTPDRQ